MIVFGKSGLDLVPYAVKFWGTCVGTRKDPSVVDCNCFFLADMAIGFVDLLYH